MQPPQIKQLMELNPQQITLGLERIKAALSIIGNPQFKYKVIHIAGTNGKGSTASFIECGIIHAGYSTGKFTSPHLHRINETISLNGEFISDEELASQYELLQAILAKHNLQLSFFEMLCLIMFDYFAKKNIDFLVLECGMGGTDDATNVVDAVIHIITNISLEHTQWLGNQLEDIARAKAGIIHNGYTILGSNSPELIAATKARTNYYICVDDYSYTEEIIGLQSIINIENEIYKLGLLGKFQVANFLCAYTALKHLNIDEKSIKYTAGNTKWAGRLQIIEDNPLVIADAMHNTQGALALVQSISHVYAPQDVVIICSILQDKAIAQIFEILSKIGETLILTSITNTPRATPIEQLYQVANNLNRFECVISVDNPKQALLEAKIRAPQMILICGSTYLLNHFIEENNV